MKTLTIIFTLLFKWIEWNGIAMFIAWVLMHLIVAPLKMKAD